MATYLTLGRGYKIMKTLILTALLAALTATAGPVYNINTHTEQSRPPIKANVLPQQREGHAEGWREVIPFAVPEGMVAVPGTRTLADTDTAPREVYQTITQAEWDAQQAAAEAERRNTPIPYDQPIEVPSLVLQSHEGLMGVGVVATDQGDLVTFTYHASPVPAPEEIKARKDAAILAYKAAKQAAKDELDALKADLKAVKDKQKP